jgi:hypothetical protein
MWASRATARGVGGALSGPHGVSISLGGHKKMSSEACLGFTGGPVDRPGVDADASVSQSFAHENTLRDAAQKARGTLNSSGFRSFHWAWHKAGSGGLTVMNIGSKQSRARGFAADSVKSEWERLREDGETINPCNSPVHPAAIAGVVGVLDPETPPKSIQQSYDAHSQCFVCGNARPPPDGVGLQSFRSADPGEIDSVFFPSALRSTAVVGDTYQGLPGIVSTGIIDALMICHGSWQSAIVLMDKAVTPRPPLVLAKKFSVEVVGRLPPGHLISVVTKKIAVQDKKEPHSVTVVMELRAVAQHDPTEKEFVCATGEALYEKVGAVRSMW